MTHRSKSTLFLIEQLIVIAVFAICAVACISILTAAYFNANDSRSTSHAILRAESAAEVFKATGGDVFAAASILGGVAEAGGLGHSGAVYATVYYDSSWKVSSEVNASYVLRIAAAGTYHESVNYIIMSGNISIERATGEGLVTFPVTARQSLEVESNG